MKKIFYLTLLVSIFTINNIFANNDEQVKIWEAKLTIPTYAVGAPEKAPSFERNFAFQRAKRGVYPYAMNDNITNDKSDKEYKALYLENEYVKLCVLPEIGGRLLYAIDKTNNYDIFYHQHVIKPSNVGMTGAWISGGVEYNVFHHHRASSQLPVDYKLVDNGDGSKTIWVGETEPRQRMSWTIGLTLYPGKSYIEVSGRLINQTQNTNSFLYWSNVSTSVNKDYQIYFPQSTEFGVYHAKNSFCHWPKTHEFFDKKQHYLDNVDASWWKNHPDPVSIFNFNTKEDYLAGYDHGKQAGTMLCGDHNIVKGGKFWLWGPGKYGAMWDCKVLTDNDGPYCELMVGAYSDNQPDYSWINPYEVKTFTKYWYGIRDIDGVKAGNERAALNIEVKDKDKVFFGANATEKIQNAKIILRNGDKIVFEKVIDIAPDIPFTHEITLAKVKAIDLKLSFEDNTGCELASFQPVVKDQNKPLPETVKPPKKPSEIGSTEECYLTGLRSRQFHNAFVDYMSYFDEVLHRDPFDTRANTQEGIYYRERGDYEKAAAYLRTAIRRQTYDYTRPSDCEAMYNLGLVLKAQGDYTAAIDTLYRASWSYMYTSASNFQLAQISVLQKNKKKALSQVAEAITYNGNNFNAYNLQASILRTLGKNDEAVRSIDRVLKIDPVNAYATYEAVLLGKTSELDFLKLMRNEAESYIELAVLYLNNGFATEAEGILMKADSLAAYPTTKYYLGFLCDKKGEKSAAMKYFKDAVTLSTDYCFPFRLETMNVYKKALEYMPNNAVTYYYMGNLMFDKQPDVALGYWQKSIANDATFAMAFRNLGWGYKFHKKDYAKAIEYYEKAISLDHTQAIIFEELDEIYETAGANVKKRCDLLATNHETVCKRYASLVREIRMLTAIGQYDKAISYLTSCFFSRQEGVNDLHDVYVDACLLAGESAMNASNSTEAEKYFKLANEYPENQWINREDNYPRNAQIYYMTAESYEKMGKKVKAKDYYKLAASVETEGTDYCYYKALAMKKINKNAKVDAIYNNLVKTGNKKVTDYVENFFVSFGPGRTVAQVNTEAYFTMGLGYLGLDNKAEAKKCFEKSIVIKPDNIWALEFINQMK